MAEGRSVLMDVSWAFERDHATSSVRLYLPIVSPEEGRGPRDQTNRWL